MRAVIVLALLLVAACGSAAPAGAPQTGERPGFIQHHPATGHLVV
jgi:hypothetical protein